MTPVLSTHLQDTRVGLIQGGHSKQVLIVQQLIINQHSKLTFSKSRLLPTFNCKMVAITRLLPEFWSPKNFSTRHGNQNGRSLEHCQPYLCSQCYTAQHSYVPLLSIRRDSPSKKSSPTFSVRPCSSVGRVTVDLIRRSWVRFPLRSKDFFFASCGSLFAFTRANAQWVIHGFK